MLPTYGEGGAVFSVQCSAIHEPNIAHAECAKVVLLDIDRDRLNIVIINKIHDRSTRRQGIAYEGTYGTAKYIDMGLWLLATDLPEATLP